MSLSEHRAGEAAFGRNYTLGGSEHWFRVECEFMEAMRLNPERRSAILAEANAIGHCREIER
jgi:hypothetical protein